MTHSNLQLIAVPLLAGLAVACAPGSDSSSADSGEPSQTRTRDLFTSSWRFTQSDPPGTPDLSYEDTKAWTLPTGNAFIADPTARHARPAANLAPNHPYIAPDFDDSSWREVTLPHDYAIEGPYTDEVPANMGHLPASGVAWYRKTFALPASDQGRSIFIDFDGAMSYSLVWVNGEIAGGWPYGYSSWRLDITPFVEFGGDNLIAVRLDNPVPRRTAWNEGSSRWYPGAGIDRDVWLVKTDPVHVAQWGTYIRTPDVTEAEATVELDITVDNDSTAAVTATITTNLYALDPAGERSGAPAASIDPVELAIPADGEATAATSTQLANPSLWGPPPTQTPSLYEAVTTIAVDGAITDVYTTRFGVRAFDYSPDRGLLVNGEPIRIQGVNDHADLGALGAIANKRGKERQLEILRAMGANAVRTSHNPEAPILYDLADRMGFLILDEAFDVWSTGKTQLDHHLFFDDWYEQDLRAMIRRDRNHASVFLWSLGNEIPEQTSPTIGPQATRIRAIANDEDPTRPTISGMNAANPGTAFADAMQAIGLNYQGSGVRDAPPEYPDFHDTYPDRFLVGTETASTVSSRGIYAFPVAGPDGMPARGSSGWTPDGQVSSYDVYHSDWSYVPDLEFENQDRWPYVAGEFVWTGFDYLGEPDPHSGTGARSSYYGIVDLAGFPKDRFYLYQARWRPELPMAHILPHWNWPGREGEITPVMVYTSGDSAELFVNGKSMGRHAKGEHEYRMRWDDVAYEPGTLRVVAYKDGKVWAEAERETTGAPAAIALEVDRTAIASDGRDLAYVTASIIDAEGRVVPTASNTIRFEVEGAGELVATDNGNAMDRVVFASPERAAFSGLALAIVRGMPGQDGEIMLRATSVGLGVSEVRITAR